MENCYVSAFELKKFLYCVEEGEDLFTLQRKFGVPAKTIIEDNELNKEVRAGQYIFINASREETFMLFPDGKIDKEDIKRKNGVKALYPFQVLYK